MEKPYRKIIANQEKKGGRRMFLFYRFLYRALFSSLILWAIYLLTIDFYSISFISYQYGHTIHFPFLGNWISLYALAIINLTTLLIITCSAFIMQFKNIKVIPASSYNLERF